MSANVQLIEGLKSLSKVKQHMLDAFEEKRIIEDSHKELFQQALEECDNKKSDFKKTKAKDLTASMPEKTDVVKKSIPLCKQSKISSIIALFGLIFYVLGILFVANCLGLKLELGFGLTFLFVIALFVSAGVWIFNNGKIGDYFEWEKDIKKWRKEAQASMISKEKFEDKCVAFEKEFLKTVKEYENLKDQCENQLNLKYEKIEAPDKEKLDALYKTIEEDYLVIENNTFIHEDHITYLETIINYLETGRADDLKEAINMAIEEERKADIENERRAEAYRQEKILQEQAHQNMLHNQEMQRMEKQRAEDARVHAAQMESQAKAQAEETRKLRQEIEKQNRANHRY